jgi:hypothetical protein
VETVGKGGLHVASGIDCVCVCVCVSQGPGLLPPGLEFLRTCSRGLHWQWAFSDPTGFQVVPAVGWSSALQHNAHTSQYAMPCHQELRQWATVADFC